MSDTSVPTALDNIAYDAPLSLPPPPKTWTDAMGGRANNRTDKLIYGRDVPIVDLTGKWIIISGANNGIGREAALTFASWGANLVLACRDPTATKSHEGHPAEVVEECRALAREKASSDGREKESVIEWWQIDMVDLGSVEAFGRRWLETGSTLDVLCNNAGVGSSPGGEEKVYLTKDGFEFVHQVSMMSMSRNAVC